MKTIQNDTIQTDYQTDNKPVFDSGQRQKSNFTINAFIELENRVEKALETYSGVHRGTGQFSVVTTALYEHARRNILEYLKLNPSKYLVLFCSGYTARILEEQLPVNSLKILKSSDLGLPLGLYAIGVKKADLSGKAPFLTGGGVARMVSANYIVWADKAQKFEAGTPPVIHAITLAAALQVIQKYGSNCFRNKGNGASEKLFFNDLPEITGWQHLHYLENSRMGLNIMVPGLSGQIPYIHLDGAASTQTFTPVWNSVKSAWKMPLSMHSSIIGEVKKVMSEFLDAGQEGYEFIFTGNTTESVNICAKMLHHEFANDNHTVIVNTVMEHNSNELPWRDMPGAHIIRLQVDSEGFIDTEILESLLKQYNLEHRFGKKRIRLITITGASNILGTYIDLKAISNLAHQYGARILVDAAQMVAHRSIYMENWDIDYMVFSGHKIYAPFGSGVFIIRKNLIPRNYPLLNEIIQYGNENISGIVAIGQSIMLLKHTGMEVIEEKESLLTRRLLDGLAKIKDITVYGMLDTHSSNMLHKGGIVAFQVKNMKHLKISKLIAERGGIGIRFGCFCTHMFIKHLLKASPSVILLQNTMLKIIPGISHIIPGLMRASISIGNQTWEVDHFTAILNDAIESEKQYKTNGNKKQMLEFCQTRLKMVLH